MIGFVTLEADLLVLLKVYLYNGFPTSSAGRFVCSRGFAESPVETPGIVVNGCFRRTYGEYSHVRP